MGDFLFIRVSARRSLSKTGIDYADPFMIKKTTPKIIKSFES